ncbi:MAG: GNAT family N-acetyltransferase [Flavobacteriaceae bacterium]|nr:GNAT family N-acetyltransferase [Flavobacteriaceae bacterium]
MITYTTSKSDIELSGIIDLQKINLPQSLTEIEIKNQGFVTVSHSLEDLRKMNNYEQNLIIKDQNKVVGYILAMTKNSKSEIPILISMFEIFDKIQYKEKLISEYNYIVVGQVCIDKEYRGKGLLDNSYTAYKNYFKEKYDIAITKIAITNERSINAHKRIGFSEIHRYTDTKFVEWSIVIWDWNKKDPIKNQII